MVQRVFFAMPVSPEIFSPDILLFLVVIATLAGFVDAIAGGGGLLIIPILLWLGLSPAQTLATNKLQAVFGSFSATAHFIRRGMIDLQKMQWSILSTFLGAAIGTTCVQLIHSEALEKLIPLLLACFALYFLFSPRVGDNDAHARISLHLFSFTFAFLIGFYDGFFGPGTGSFFAATFVFFLGYNLIKATAHAKLLNFISNFSGLLFFILGGHVIWEIGLVMATGQLIGAYAGAHMASRHGSIIIKPLLVVISLALTLKLLFLK